MVGREPTGLGMYVLTVCGALALSGQFWSVASPRTACFEEGWFLFIFSFFK